MIFFFCIFYKIVILLKMLFMLMNSANMIYISIFKSFIFTIAFALPSISLQKNSGYMKISKFSERTNLTSPNLDYAEFYIRILPFLPSPGVLPAGPLFHGALFSGPAAGQVAWGHAATHPQWGVDHRWRQASPSWETKNDLRQSMSRRSAPRMPSPPTVPLIRSEFVCSHVTTTNTLAMLALLLFSVLPCVCETVPALARLEPAKFAFYSEDRRKQ